MPRPVILVVDDDPGVRESFRLILEDHYDVLAVPAGPRALEVVRSAQVDLVLLDIRLPDMDGIEVLERTKAIDEGIEVILVTAVKTVRTAVAAMKLGAFDYLTKPFEEDELLQLVRRALEKRSLEREVAFLRAELARTQESEEIVGQHPAMQKLRRVIAQVARTTATVLVSGPSGARSRAPTRASWASSSSRRAARCSSTRSAPSRPSSRRSSCACSRSARSSASAGRGPSKLTCASSRRRTRTSRRRCGAGPFARTSTIGSTWCRSRCHRSRSGARTSHCSWTTSSVATAASSASGWKDCPTRRSPRSRSTDGPATFVSSRT